jgi:SHS2 domain-containing protein
MSWALEDHTADVLLRVEAESWSALLREAARCFGAFVGGGAAPEGRQHARIEVEGVDAADTWVRYWRASHRLWAVEALLVVDARVAPGLAPRVARAEVTCVPADVLDPSRGEDVKAVTWHGAEAAEVEGGWRGRIVLDV